MFFFLWGRESRFVMSGVTKAGFHSKHRPYLHCLGVGVGGGGVVLIKRGKERGGVQGPHMKKKGLRLNLRAGRRCEMRCYSPRPTTQTGSWLREARRDLPHSISPNPNVPLLFFMVWVEEWRT